MDTQYCRGGGICLGCSGSCNSRLSGNECVGGSLQPMIVHAKKVPLFPVQGKHAWRPCLIRRPVERYRSTSRGVWSGSNVLGHRLALRNGDLPYHDAMRWSRRPRVLQPGVFSKASEAGAQQGEFAACDDDP